MATGHMLGDTGDFSNTIYAGFPVPGAGNSSRRFSKTTRCLADVDEHFSGNYLDEATILKLARDKGYSTASIGKIGPALIFDHTERTGEQTIIVDDATGSAKGHPAVGGDHRAAQGGNLPLARPPRGANGDAGNMSKPGTLTPNVVQQDYFAAATRGRPAAVQGPQQAVRAGVLVARSDGTQHNQGDSLNTLVPGINGPTSLAAIRNADDDLARIRSALNELGLLDTTDIIAIAITAFRRFPKRARRVRP